MKKRIFLIPIILIFLVAFFVNYSCSSDSETANAPTVFVPVVITSNILNVSQTSAIGGGSITSDGGSNIFAKGVCWNTSSNPTIALNSKTIDGAGSNSFSSTLSSLIVGTTYYVRAYATNSKGTAYGNEVVFTTANTNLPTLTTTNISSITQTTAISGGEIANDGGGTVTSRGICWSTNPNPTIAGITKTVDGSGIGLFSSTLSGLITGTTYYVRAYATNSAGTSYGNEISFTTGTIAIGQNYEGGVIGYMLQPGDSGYIAGQNHGLIVASSDQGTNLIWGCVGLNIAGTSASIGSGQTNTTTIVNNCSTNGIAAKICSDLILNGYDDWFLPSKEELNKLYLNKTTIGGFDNNQSYLSSTQNDNTNPYPYQFAWGVSFNNGAWFNAYKTDAFYNVRAIRKF